MVRALRRSCLLVLLATASGCRANLGASGDDAGLSGSKSATPGASSTDDAGTTPISGAEGGAPISGAQGGAAGSSADASMSSAVDGAAPDSDGSLDGGLPEALDGEYRPLWVFSILDGDHSTACPPAGARRSR